MAYRIELTEANGARLSVVHRETIWVLGWAAFLAVFAAGAWKGWPKPEWVILIGGVAAVLALLLPAT